MWRSLGLAALLVSLTGCHMLYGPRPAAARTTVLSCMKQVALGNLIYQGDYNDTAPPVDWRNVTFPYIKNKYQYENRGGSRPYIFAHRATLIGKKMTKVAEPARTVLLLDVMESSDPYLAELPAAAYRKSPMSNPNTFFGFADGHVKSFGTTSAATVR